MFFHLFRLLNLGEKTRIGEFDTSVKENRTKWLKEQVKLEISLASKLKSSVKTKVTLTVGDMCKLWGRNEKVRLN